MRQVVYSSVIIAVIGCAADDKRRRRSFGYTGLFRGIVIPQTIAAFRPIGVMKMIDNGEKDDKIIGVYVKDPMTMHIKDLKDLPEHALKEYKEFFQTYKDLENKKVTVTGFHGKTVAYGLIMDSIKTYEKKFKRKHRK